MVEKPIVEETLVERSVKGKTTQEGWIAEGMSSKKL